MTINILVLALVIGLAYWWSTQGFLSSCLHMILTIIAAALSFALWEPLTIGFLLERMPEFAWGIGLLAPFAIILLILRFVSDKWITGNLDFSYAINSIGGGACGLVTGIITAGILVISFLFIGPLDFGYKPYNIEANGNITRKDTLWIPVDDITGNFFNRLSSGALSTSHAMATYIPNIARSAGEFKLVARKHGRHSIRQSSIKINGYYERTKNNPTEIKPSSDDKVVIITTEIQKPAFGHGTFTASKAQIKLICLDNNDQPYIYYPEGYVQRNTFGTFSSIEWARSKANVQNVTFNWIFHVPQDQNPIFLQFKHLRININNEPDGKADKLVNNTNFSPIAKEKPTTQSQQPRQQSTSSLNLGVQDITVRIHNSLPFRINRNTLANNGGEVKDDAVYFSNWKNVERGKTGGQRLSINKIYCDSASSTIVQVHMKKRNALSLYGRAVAFAGTVLPLTLTDSDGDSYQPFGYFLVKNNHIMDMYINPDTTISALTQIDMDNFDEEDDITLIFSIAKGVRLVEFNIGNNTEHFDLIVQ